MGDVSTENACYDILSIRSGLNVKDIVKFFPINRDKQDMRSILKTWGEYGAEYTTHHDSIKEDTLSITKRHPEKLTDKTPKFFRLSTFYHRWPFFVLTKIGVEDG